MKIITAIMRWWNREELARNEIISLLRVNGATTVREIHQALRNARIPCSQRRLYNVLRSLIAADILQEIEWPVDHFEVFGNTVTASFGFEYRYALSEEYYL
jgi:DNA-binding Lrp family transcriptional regulator